VYAAALDTAPAEDAGARARHAQSHEMALADLNRQRIVTTDALDSVQAELDELFAITRG